MARDYCHHLRIGHPGSCPGGRKGGISVVSGASRLGRKLQPVASSKRLSMYTMITLLIQKL